MPDIEQEANHLLSYLLNILNDVVHGNREAAEICLEIDNILRDNWDNGSIVQHALVRVKMETEQCAVNKEKLDRLLLLVNGIEQLLSRKNEMSSVTQSIDDLTLKNSPPVQKLFSKSECVSSSELYRKKPVVRVRSNDHSFAHCRLSPGQIGVTRTWTKPVGMDIKRSMKLFCIIVAEKIAHLYRRKAALHRTIVLLFCQLYGESGKDVPVTVPKVDHYLRNPTRDLVLDARLHSHLLVPVLNIRINEEGDVENVEPAVDDQGSMILCEVRFPEGKLTEEASLLRGPRLSAIPCIDVGSFLLKTGFSTESDPRVLLRCVQRNPKNATCGMENGYRNVVGQRAIVGSGKVDTLVKDGTFNKYVFESMLVHLIEEEDVLHMEEDGHMMAFCVNPMVVNENGIRRIFHVVMDMVEEPHPKILIVDAAESVLFLSGHHTGVVVDLGYECSTYTLFINAAICSRRVVRFGGCQIDQLLQSKLWIEDGIRITDVQSVCELKETFLSLDPVGDVVFVTSNGQRVVLHSNTNQMVARAAVEPYRYDPFYGIESNLVTVLKSMIEDCDIGSQSSIWNNVVLSGGGSEVRGLKEFLQQSTDIPRDAKFTILGKNASWRGLGMLANSPDRRARAISVEQFVMNGGPEVFELRFEE